MSKEIKNARKATDAEIASLKDRGSKQAPEVEAEGQYMMQLRCWNCGTVNTVNSHWEGFFCYWCGAANY